MLPLSLSDLRLHIPIAEDDDHYDDDDGKQDIAAAINVYNNQLASFVNEDITLSSGIKRTNDKQESNGVKPSDDEKESDEVKSSEDEQKADEIIPPQYEQETYDDFAGGICRNGSDLRSLLIRYFCERLVDCSIQGTLVKDKIRWKLSDLGYNVQALLHRRVQGLDHYSEYYPVFCTANTHRIMNFLDYQGSLLLPWISASLRKTVTGVDTLDGVMNHLINRGHKPAPFVEGLTVELLPFQLQSLQWALERENNKGGIQSYFNTKIANCDNDVYYNAITGKISRTEPTLVRGGIIAEQMVRRFFYEYVVVHALITGTRENCNNVGAYFAKSSPRGSCSLQFSTKGRPRA